MDRITKRFKELKERGEGGLISFITAGDPSADATIKIADALVSGGVDFLELGLPFSDPMADGPTIQKGTERSLKAGMTPDIYFEVAKEIKGVPKICLTYYNIVLRRGFERFIKDCKRAGIDGLIVADLPIDEAAPLLERCRAENFHLIFLAAPTTSDERLRWILRESSAFLYLVSLLGVTGERERLSAYVSPLLRRIKALEQELEKAMSVAVGFGISKPEHVRSVIDAGADAAIVGSAFVRLIEDNVHDEEKMLRSVEEFARALKDAACGGVRRAT